MLRIIVDPNIIVDPKVLFLFWRENDEISLLNKLITGKKKIHKSTFWKISGSQIKSTTKIKPRSKEK